MSTETVAFAVNSAAQMVALGRDLGACLRAGDLVVLDGPLGAGKTTFSRGVGQGLNVRGAVTSPTFVIARVHPPLAAGPALVHVDAYRLGDLTDLDALDLDASLEESVTLVEWGLGKVEQLSDSWLTICFDRDLAEASDEDPSSADEPRRVTFTAHGRAWDGRQLPAGS